jgi:hypothetical protein
MSTFAISLTSNGSLWTLLRATAMSWRTLAAPNVMTKATTSIAAASSG